MCFKDALLVFQDLSAQTAGESGTFLKMKDMSRVFGLELIESIIQQNHTLLENVDSLLLLHHCVMDYSIQNY